MNDNKINNIDLQKPIVSVIILNYNTEKKYIDKLFSTIADQDFLEKMEIIVVDNASTDQSLNYIIQNYQFSLKLKIIRNGDNLGYAKGNNIGIRHAIGKYLLIINPDTSIKENTAIRELYESYLDLVIREIKVGAVGGFENNKNGHLHGELIEDESIITMNSIDILGYPFSFYYLFKKGDKLTPINLGNKKRAFKTFHVTGAFLFIEKNLFVKVGMFDELYFMYEEEIDLCWRLNIFGYENFIINIDYYHYQYLYENTTYLYRKINIFYALTHRKINLIKNYNNYIIPCFISIFHDVILFFIFFFIYDIDIASIVPKSYLYIFKNRKQIFKWRKFIKTNRKINDIYIIKKYQFYKLRFFSDIKNIITHKKLPKFK